MFQVERNLEHETKQNLKQKDYEGASKQTKRR